MLTLFLKSQGLSDLLILTFHITDPVFLIVIGYYIIFVFSFFKGIQRVGCCGIDKMRASAVMEMLYHFCAIVIYNKNCMCGCCLCLVQAPKTLRIS